MVENILKAYREVARQAAQGEDLDKFRPMMHDGHDMLQAARDEAGESLMPDPRPVRRCP